ncbi:SCO family protein [Tepidimonas sp.]|uniref:SCO family protein n=1 Tax=Tepidimonas sp. TaxID=2002775 RepID=UPI002FDF779E
MTDQHGQRRTLEDFRGKAVMLYLGFVQCPDVCPTALARAVEGAHRLRIVHKHKQSADDYAHDIAWLLREGA